MIKNNITRLSLLLFLCNYINIYAQKTITGNFTDYKKGIVSLKGFTDFEEILFSTDSIKEDGSFMLSYPKKYEGMGTLTVNNTSKILLLLAKENITITGKNIEDYNSFKIQNSEENSILDNYIAAHTLQNKKMKGWQWLYDNYQLDSIKNNLVLNGILKEIKQLKAEETTATNTLPKNKYASYYIPLRKLTLERPESIFKKPHRIPQHKKDFFTYKLASQKLANSGLLKEMIEGHYIMLENYYGVSDSCYINMNKSTDYIISQFRKNTKKLKLITSHLFTFLEKRSLYPAAAYLSTTMLTTQKKALDRNLSGKFEKYRAMKKGNQAPDIVFKETSKSIKNGFINNEKTLKEIKSNYKLVYFWESGTKKSMTELLKLQSMYFKLQNKDVAVISISLDTNKQAFLKASGNFKWYSYSDFKQWKNQAVKEYFIHETPTGYLLDSNNTIIYKINSAAFLEQLVDNRL